jgi:hypothetical protein
MQPFDQALFDHFERLVIYHEDALRNAGMVNDLRLQIKLYGKESKDRHPSSHQVSRSRRSAGSPRKPFVTRILAAAGISFQKC